jgi:integrase
MRVSEILYLTWDRVDPQGGFIRLKAEDTKTREGRAIPLNKVLTGILKGCIRHLHHSYVFTHNDEPIKYSKLRYLFERGTTRQ